MFYSLSGLPPGAVDSSAASTSKSAEAINSSHTTSFQHPVGVFKLVVSKYLKKLQKAPPLEGAGYDLSYLS